MKQFTCTGYIADHEGEVTLEVDDSELFIHAFDNNSSESVFLRLPNDAAIEMRDWLNNYIERYTT